MSPPKISCTIMRVMMVLPFGPDNPFYKIVLGELFN